MSTITHPKYKVDWTVYDNANFSTAKQQFSFPKANRFNRPKQLVHDQVGYELPSTKSGRGASFGIGDRKLHSIRDSPSPDYYDPRNSTIEHGQQQSMSRRSNNKSFCFGSGREAYSKVVMPAKLNIPDQCVPGPGTYNFTRTIGHDRKKFTFAHKFIINDPSEIEKKKNVPGPGQYINRLQLDKYGQYFVSSYLNSKASTFSPSNRFNETVKENPGPGEYDLPGRIDQSNGFQLVSNFHTVKVRRFGTAQRPEIADIKQAETPGPGSYRPPSDFGYLDFKPKSGYMNSRTPKSFSNTARSALTHYKAMQSKQRHGSLVNFEKKTEVEEIPKRLQPIVKNESMPLTIHDNYRLNEGIEDKK